MGLFDNAFKNETFTKPPAGGGLSKPLKTVKATYNGKSIDAVVGGKLRNVEQGMRIGQKYSCTEGDCGTCELLMNGRKVRPCVAKVPNKDFTL